MSIVTLGGHPVLIHAKVAQQQRYRQKAAEMAGQTRRASHVLNLNGYGVDWPIRLLWLDGSTPRCKVAKKTVRIFDHGWREENMGWVYCQGGIGMNSYSYGGLGKPNNIKRDLSPEKMELLEWVIGWDKKWKLLCEALHGLYTLQTLRCNKFPELNRYNEIEKLDLHRNTNANNDCKRYKKLGNAPWVQILVHISTFLIGDFDDTIEYLGMRGLAKFQTFEQAVLKYRNSEYVAPKVAPNRAPRRASLSSTTRKTEYHRFLESPRRRSGGTTTRLQQRCISTKSTTSTKSP